MAVDTTADPWRHADGSAHSVGGPMGCLRCAQVRRKPTAVAAAKAEQRLIARERTRIQTVVEALRRDRTEADWNAAIDAVLAIVGGVP